MREKKRNEDDDDTQQTRQGERIGHRRERERERVQTTLNVYTQILPFGLLPTEIGIQVGR